MGKSKKDPRAKSGNKDFGISDQDQENRNIDQALKEESKSESYPEQVNDAQEREVFNADEKSEPK